MTRPATHSGPIPIAIPPPPHATGELAMAIDAMAQVAVGIQSAVERLAPTDPEGQIARRVRQSTFWGSVAIIALIACAVLVYRDFSRSADVERQGATKERAAIMKRLNAMQLSIDAAWRHIAPGRIMPPISDATTGSTN